MDRNELIKHLKTKPTWSSKDVISLISNLSINSRFTPKDIRVGDIFYFTPVKHPILLLKKVNNGYLAVMLSSTEGEHNLTKLVSRNKKDSFVCKNVIIVEENTEKLEKYICSVDTDEIYRILSLIKKEITNIL